MPRFRCGSYVRAGALPTWDLQHSGNVGCQIIGDSIGLLKLIHLERHQLLGAYIIGECASELIHIGQAVLAFGGTGDYFVNTMFNYPTLAECYKTAAFDGINRL